MKKLKNTLVMLLAVLLVVGMMPLEAVAAATSAIPASFQSQPEDAPPQNGEDPPDEGPQPETPPAEEPPPELPVALEILAFQQLEDALAQQTALLGTELEALDLPGALWATTKDEEGATREVEVPVLAWQCAPQYDAAVQQLYTFSPIIDDTQYVLGDDAQLPAIIVLLYAAQEDIAPRPMMIMPMAVTTGGEEAVRQKLWAMITSNTAPFGAHPYATYTSSPVWLGTFYNEAGERASRECYGFAKLVFRELYGTDADMYYNGTPRNGNVTLVDRVTRKFSVDDVEKLFAQAKAGDIIQVDEPLCHSMIFYDRTSTGIQVYDCNWTNSGTYPKCIIRFREVSYSYLANNWNTNAISLLRAVNYPTEPAQTPPTTVSLSQGSGSVYVGDTFALSAAISPAGAAQGDVSWASSNPAVAAVSGNGAQATVTAVAAGTATITCTADGVSASCVVQVKPATIGVSSIELPATKEMMVNSCGWLPVTIWPANASYGNIQWSSSNPSVVGVSGKGNPCDLEAFGAGTAVITCKVGGFTKSCTVTVVTSRYPVESVTLSEEALTLGLNQSATVTAGYAPQHSDEFDGYRWLVTDPCVEIDTTDGTLTITGVAPGTAEVYCFAGTQYTKCTVTVLNSTNPAQSVSVAPASAQLHTGLYQVLTASVLPGNAQYTAPVWVSSDPSVARISSRDRKSVYLMGMAPGNANITCTVDGKQTDVQVTVQQNPNPVQSLSLDATTIILERGQSYYPQVSAFPADAIYNNVQWSSSAPDIANVYSTGQIFAIMVGTARITCNINGKTAVIDVNVIEKTNSNPEYFSTDGQGTLVKYTGPGGVVVIPEGITRIGQTAFSSVPLYSLTLPDSMEYFDGQIGGTYTTSGGTISNRTGSYSLVHLDVGNMSGLASFSCSSSALASLQMVDVGAGFTGTLSPNSYSGTVLTEINVDEANSLYSSRDGVLYNKDKTRLLYYPAAHPREDFTLPASVTYLEFSNYGGGTLGEATNLKNIYVEAGNPSYFSLDGVLAGTPYNGMVELRCYPKGRTDTAYTIPQNVNSASNAFNGAKSLEAIYVAEGNTHFISDNGVLYIDSGVGWTILQKYPEGRKDTSYTTLPQTTSIWPWAFENNPWLQTLTLTSGIQEWHGTADWGTNLSLNGMTALTALYAPACLPTINRYGMGMVTVYPHLNVYGVAGSPLQRAVEADYNHNMTFVPLEGMDEEAGQTLVYPQPGQNFYSTYPIRRDVEVSFSKPVDLAASGGHLRVLYYSSNDSIYCEGILPISAAEYKNDDHTTILFRDVLPEYIFSGYEYFILLDPVATAESVQQGNVRYAPGVWNRQDWGFINKYQEIPATCVTLSESAVTRPVSAYSFPLTAAVQPINAANKNVTWSSSNPSVATVQLFSGTAYVQLLKQGTAIITATTADGGFTASCTVTVTAPVAITLNKTQLNLYEGENALLEATVSPPGASAAPVQWYSMDESVATVDENGRVMAVGAGSTIVGAYSADDAYGAECAVTVSGPTKVASIGLSHTKLVLETQATQQLNATVLPADAANKALIWSSSNPAVATVSPEGLVQAVGGGKAVITAAAADGSGKTANCTVVVRFSGDLDESGVLDAADILMLRRHVLGMQPVEETLLPIADLNEDGHINVTDILFVRRKILNLIT